ncbi:MAG: hypothetical protein KatS3mg077_0586 [Candidatus Binatia bacterium]|nr:MAG: hypothetical protein KatS3mg077_0586 [Candidatus Binatia bacterium]
MRTPVAQVAILIFVLTSWGCGDDGEPTDRTPAAPVLRVGVAAVPITPCGENADWDGPITSTGVWGEQFEDRNGNGRWDLGEPYTNDPRNSELDPSSRTKYDGIFLAGFGSNRVALGCHDDIWARALVLEAGDTKVALVSVDLVGTLKHGRYYGFAKAESLVDPSLGIDAFFYSSTHNHEGPDALGLWGSEMFRDGKFPLYLQFVDRQVARAINQAADPARMRPVRVRAAVTNPQLDAELRGLQVRTRCRPPWFFDDELRVVQFLDWNGATVATLVNWNTHPESLEDQNLYVSSDFPGFIRSRIEAALGGTAVYFSGDLGAVEIVGDTCVGNADPRPGGGNEFDRRDDLGFARTQRIGELVGDAALRALARAEELDIHALDARLTRYYLSGSNALFFFANQIGILDLDEQVFSFEHCPPGAGICVPVEQQLLQLLDRGGRPQLQLVTLPGEVFPELVYGVEQHRRTDCPEAHTGEPYEPALLPHLRAPYRVFLGLSPDELGYIVPGYDFYPAPSLDEEARDVCHGSSYDPAFPNRRVPPHYHESLSVGLDIAAAVNCKILEMLGLEAEFRNNGACQRTFGRSVPR